MKAADAALWLGIYATLVSTVVALLTLYGEVFVRVRVKVSEGVFVPRGDGPGLVMTGDWSDSLSPAERTAARPIFVAYVANRGRRPVQLKQIAKPDGLRYSTFSDLMSQLPATLEPGHSAEFMNGALGGYSHGAQSMRRFFVEDGAGRRYPLRERWRLAVEDLLYRRPRRWWQRRKRRGSSRP